MKFIFWHSDKHGILLQIATIILGVRNHEGSKYPNQQIYNIFAISQGKRER